MRPAVAVGTSTGALPEQATVSSVAVGLVYVFDEKPTMARRGFASFVRHFVILGVST
jgi:hypothetical protein